MSAEKDNEKDAEHYGLDDVSNEGISNADETHQIKMDFGAKEEAELRERAAKERQHLEDQKARKKAMEKNRRTKEEAAAKLRDEEWEKFKQEVEAKRKPAASPGDDESARDQETSASSEQNSTALSPSNHALESSAPAEDSSENAGELENAPEPFVLPEEISEQDAAIKSDSTFEPDATFEEPAAAFEPDSAFEPEATFEPEAVFEEPAAVSVEPAQERTESINLKRIGIVLVAAFFGTGIWMYFGKEDSVNIDTPNDEAISKQDSNLSQEADPDLESNSGQKTNSNSNQKPDSNPEAYPKQEASSNQEVSSNQETNSTPGANSNLIIGGSFGDGIIYSIDPSGTTGKIAYSKDLGPMSWKEAVDASEQLGEGWRLPTMDELGFMYRNIGQGAANQAQFADELYWSSNPFDENQARLFRFSDGNTSFHYNNGVPYRKFLVRPVRDVEL